MDVPAELRFLWITYSPEYEDAWLQVLSDEERQRADAFGSLKRKQEFLTGRAAARQLLAERMNRPPEAIELEVIENGAVKVGETPLFLSITHAGPHAVAAVGERRLGVDMEQIVSRRTDLDRFLCGPEEEAMFADWPMSHNSSCILCWTLKEATLKAMRTGLRVSPKKVRLSVDIVAGSGEAAVDGHGSWMLRFLERENCYLSLAYEDRMS